MPHSRNGVCSSRLLRTKLIHVEVCVFVCCLAAAAWGLCFLGKQLYPVLHHVHRLGQIQVLKNSGSHCPLNHGALAASVLESPAVLLKGLAGASLGVWVAHGEGRCYFPDPAIRGVVEARKLAPLRYADDAGEPTAARVAGVRFLCCEYGTAMGRC